MTLTCAAALAAVSPAQEPTEAADPRNVAGMLAVGRIAPSEPRRPPVSLSYALFGEQIGVQFDGREITVTIDGVAAPSDRLDGPRRAPDGRIMTPAVTLLDDAGERLALFTAGTNAITVSFYAHEPNAWLGVDLAPLDPGLAAHIPSLERAPSEYSVVRAVHPGSPAAKAGLAANDILTAIDGAPGASSEQVRQVVRKHRPGEQLPVSGLRAGERFEAVVELGEAPTSGSVATLLPGGSRLDGKDGSPFFGSGGAGGAGGGGGAGGAGGGARATGLPTVQFPFRYGRLGSPSDNLEQMVKELREAVDRIEKQLAERKEH